MNNLNAEQLIWLIASGILFFLSYWNFVREREKFSMVCLFFGAFFLRFFMIRLDPYLHEWDEHFHALVAKNMLTDPFRPVLRKNPVLPYDYKDWRNNYIWVHKQPLFLWQMALSMKVFGVNEVAMRLPSAVMGAIQTLVIYRIGKLMINKQTGFYAALLFAGSYYQLQQSSGLFGMDHNDIAFSFYITLSVWAYFELQLTQKKFWVVLIGIFTGCAILNKWMPALIVYGCWGLSVLFSKEQRGQAVYYMQIAIAFGITCLVFLPWQIYIRKYFPVETSWEYQFNKMHITQALEGHAGTRMYYLQEFVKDNYGWWAVLPFATGLFYLFKKVRKPNVIIFIVASISVIYAFFSIIVATKAPWYIFMVSPFIFITIAAGIHYFFTGIQRLIPSKISLFSITVLLTGFFLLNLAFQMILLTRFHSTAVENRGTRMHNTPVYKRLDALVPEDYVVFNTMFYQNIDAMFYSHRNVYDWMPSEEQYQLLKKNHIKIAAFEEHWAGEFPEFIKNDTDVLIIHETLW